MALKLGELLVKNKIITREQLEAGLKESRRTGEILGEALMRLGFINEEQLLRGFSEQLAIPYYPSLKNISVDSELIKAVPVKFVRHYKFMPLKLEGNTLTIAVSNPLDVWPLEDIKLHLGFETERVLTLQGEITEAIKRCYGIGAETIEKILEQETVKEESAQEKQVSAEEDIEKFAESSSVIKLVNQILTEAIQTRATDIHIEPYRDKVRIRYRIDGVLYDMRVSEDIKYLHSAIVSRIKIISRLDIVERRIAQDGRAKVVVANKEVDLRVSILPSFRGENVVIRILPTQMLLDLKKLGLTAEDLKMIEKLINKSHGIVFLCGPTGSGKTTTLYACLTHINSPDVKIVTIEDPVEYELTGITQIQVNPPVGLTFASILRSVLRHDPDVMMVGEARDLETAELAIRAALTGHLVFSTLHTNDACSGVTRLLDMGIEPFLLASSVEAFVAQRLIRVICPDCRQECAVQSSHPKDLKHVYKGKGCELCNFTGYRGRTAIYEFVLVDEQVRELILKKASAEQIKNKMLALRRLKTLWQQGCEKINKGVTTPEEVMRVIEQD